METGMAALRVLIAEDNEHMRGLLVGMLQAVGVTQIRQVKDGGDALEVLRRWDADLAFVDMRMSPMDGIEFTKLVRTAAGAANPYLPIIMLTGHAHLGRVTEARDAEVSEFLVKPLDPKTVVERLRMVIDRQRPFVRSAAYVGPDRRRKNLADYNGPRRREEDRRAPASRKLTEPETPSIETPALLFEPKALATYTANLAELARSRLAWIGGFVRLRPEAQLTNLG